MAVSYTKIEVNAIAHNLEVTFETCTHHTGPYGGRFCWHATLQEPTSPDLMPHWDVMDRVSLWHAVIDAIRTHVLYEIDVEMAALP